VRTWTLNTTLFIVTQNDMFHHGFAHERIAGWIGDAGFTGVRVGDAHTITKPDAAGQARSHGVFLAIGQRK
jgi:hypothetical protein